jgi:hypothetical protein
MEKEEVKEFYCYLRPRRSSLVSGAITAVFNRPLVVQGWVIGGEPAAEVPTLVPASHIEVGFAFCSEYDNFGRERGKLIASSRLKANPIRIADLCKNEKGKLEIVPTLLKFFQTVIDGVNIEQRLHVRPYGRGRSFNDGDFLPWLQTFIMLLVRDEHAQKD